MENGSTFHQLEPGSNKHICPKCGKKRYVRYINSDKREYLPVQYGRCDREVSCGYHLNPYRDGFTSDQPVNHQLKGWHPSVRERQPERSHIPFAMLKRTFRTESYVHNGFLQNLTHQIPFPLDKEVVERVIEHYYLGTVNKGYMTGALTIPFINRSGNVRAIQVKKFDEHNHSTHTNWVHSLTKNYLDKENRPYPEWLEDYLKNDKLIDCLFGEHLLDKYPNNPIALVEAPKTAIYATLYFGFPDVPENLLWLAVFNSSSLTSEKCQELKGRRVVLFPDLSSDGSVFKKWSEKANEFNKSMPSTNFTVSDLLERNANVRDREKGLDLADYLIKLDWREFRLP